MSVLEPLNVSGPYRVYDSVRHRRSEASQQIFDAICEAAGVVVTEEFDTDVDAVIVRRADSETRACRTARDRGIPLFRSDEFTGRIAEAMLSRFVGAATGAAECGTLGQRRKCSRFLDAGVRRCPESPARSGPRQSSSRRRCRLLDRTLIWNQRHLLHALREFEQFYSGH
ncbi:hypothetical protein GCM10009541_49640 [Micromonospora gifhornensis]|uniref:Uncharacterized protein n=1 Tax=Micromonospora gifhornensis TaxID=84594 RepID=A0ABQ4IKQ2_9ACTN|nr:hypothetical protein [Micromonospora gifhornensis]GIJ18496.1 hypothetical protein Vgi01_51800 [Micromonospora gifhornensis]